MQSIQLALTNLNNYVQEKEANNKFAENFQSNKEELINKIKSIIKTLKGMTVTTDVKASHDEIKNELKLLKNECKGENVPEKLSLKIQKINGMIQNKFCGPTSFTSDALDKINNVPKIVEIFRSGKEKMALGEYGSRAYTMIIEDEDDIWDCTPRFAVLNLLVTRDKEKLAQLRKEGTELLQRQADALIFMTYEDQQAKRKAIIEKTIPHFNELCDALEALCNNGGWQKLDAGTQQIIIKKLANEKLNEDESKVLEDEEIKKIVRLIQEIPQIITTNDRAEFGAIMKGAFVSEEKLKSEMNKAGVSPQTRSSSSSATTSMPLPQPHFAGTMSANLSQYLHNHINQIYQESEEQRRREWRERFESLLQPVEFHLENYFVPLNSIPLNSNNIGPQLPQSVSTSSDNSETTEVQQEVEVQIEREVEVEVQPRSQTTTNSSLAQLVDIMRPLAGFTGTVWNSYNPPAPLVETIRRNVNQALVRILSSYRDQERRHDTEDVNQALDRTRSSLYQEFIRMLGMG